MLHWQWCSIYESIKDAGLNVIFVRDVRFACPSRSMSRTFFPICAMQAPIEAVEVVFDTPPLWLANVMIFCFILISIMYICINVYNYTRLQGYVATCINVYKVTEVTLVSLVTSPDSLYSQEKC